MSRYLERSMLKGEHPVYTAQLHWIVYYSGAVTTLMGTLVSRLGTALARWVIGDTFADFVAKPVSYVAVGIIMLGAFQLLTAFIRQISTELVITNQRVIAKHGFIATTTFEVMLSKVEGANIDQTVAGRVLNYGTVMVKGTGGGISPIDHVAAPYEFHSQLMAMMHSLDSKPVVLQPGESTEDGE
jgi:uncharacterized membrane protein YdbT with pleckstrin-like domain